MAALSVRQGTCLCLGLRRLGQRHSQSVRIPVLWGSGSRPSLFRCGFWPFYLRRCCSFHVQCCCSIDASLLVRAARKGALHGPSQRRGVEAEVDEATVRPIIARHSGATNAKGAAAVGHRLTVSDERDSRRECDIVAAKTVMGVSCCARTGVSS